MSKHLSLKQRLYNQTPHYITLGGYLLGFSIIGGAVSTRYVQTDISVQGTLSFKAAQHPVALDHEAVVLRRLRKAGSQVKRGDEVSVVATNSEAVAGYVVAFHARNALKELQSVSAAPVEVVNQLQRLATSAEANWTTATVSAPIDGWLVKVDGAAAEGAQESIVPPGKAIAQVATLDRLGAQIELTSDHNPTVQPGELLTIICSDLGGQTLLARLNQVETTMTVEIPKSNFNEASLSTLKTGAPVSVTVMNTSLQAHPALGVENLTLNIPSAPLPRKLLQNARGTNAVEVRVAGVAKEISGKIGTFKSRIVLEMDAAAMSESLRSVLALRLTGGSAEITAGSCWVKVSTRSLFNRLFSK